MSSRRLALLVTLALPTFAGCSKESSPKDEACARLEEAWSIDQVPAGPPITTSTPTPDLAAASKLALAVFHFNVQYVAGGLRGFPDGVSNEALYDYDEAGIEDLVVKEGLEPLLDLYLAHPDFGGDVELQAYMVEVIALRHPGVLEKMRTLADRGQVDFDSFHYSDQLYVAYPDADLEVSLDLTREVFRRAGLRLGRAIFAQEGQFARGQLAIAKRHGYEVSILPKNLFTYQLGDAPADAHVFYEDPAVAGHAVLLGGHGWSTPGTDLRWTFMDDGEIAFSEGKLNPYFGGDYVVDPKRVADYAAQLQSMADQGYRHVTVTQAVRALRTRGIAPAPLPAIFDGTWQPKNTENLFRWMGGGGLFRSFESDSDVLAGAWRARRAVEEAARATSGMSGAVARGVSAAWREVLFAEVSDATGWNPFKTEVEYSRAHAKAAEALVADVYTCAGLAPKETWRPSCTASTSSTADVGAHVVTFGRAVTIAVARCTAEAGERLTAIDVAVSKEVDTEVLLDPDEGAGARTLELRFDRVETGEAIELSPALDPAIVAYRLDDYTFDELGVALPLGLASLGGDRWVIADQDTERTAALVARTGAARATLRFRDDTVSRASASTRRWYVLEGAMRDAALALAKSINRPE